MEILVVFIKEVISSIRGSLQELTTKIRDVSTACFSEDNGEKISVEITEGQVQFVSETVKIVVFVSSEKMKNNMGALLVDFKKEVLKIFDQYGLALEKKELDVRVKPILDMQRISSGNKRSKFEKMEESAPEFSDEFDYEKKAKQYIPVNPLYSFDRVILQEDVKDKIEEAIGILECENKVFNEWGLYEIQPHPSTSLSFFGPSGTGKTMAAEAVADKLGKKILKVSYADVESKYHGEGPKMVKSIFLAAKNADAVLFFDEADSLLSKRLTSVNQGSEQAINSMRSQLLICLEEYRGIVIFATNLVVNYDPAFLTRLISIEFKLPDAKSRERIWDVHIRSSENKEERRLNIPLSNDVNVTELSEKYEFVGREIRNAVVSACVSVALDKRDEVCQADFIRACEKIVSEKKSLAEARDQSKAAEALLVKAVKNKIEKQSITEKAIDMEDKQYVS